MRYVISAINEYDLDPYREIFENDKELIKFLKQEIKNFDDIHIITVPALKRLDLKTKPLEVKENK